MPAVEPREITESFRIERVLKSSRSGIVFRAHDPASGEPVAIKLMPPPPGAAAAASRARFVALAELLTLLQPPGFPPLRDFGFTPDGGAFMVMEYIEGTRLDRVADLEPARAVALMLPVLDALAVLAGKGLQHGNLSPDNVLVGGDGRAWVTGLGTAAFRPAGSLARALLDDTGSTFVAPECLAGEGVPAAEAWRGDLWSAARALASLLGAEVAPADAPAPAVTLPAPAAASLADPNQLRGALELCLRADPRERPASLADLREALRRTLAAPEGGPAAAATVAPAAPPPPAPQLPQAAESAAPPAAGAEPSPPVDAAAAPAPEEVEWEEPEGAPAWLQDGHGPGAPVAPEPRPGVPAEAPPGDDLDDTNPVPAQRRAELPARPAPAAPEPEPPPAPPAPAVTAPRPEAAPALPLRTSPAPTAGAPLPLPTPVITASPAPAAPPPAVASVQPVLPRPELAPAAPALPLPRLQPATAASTPEAAPAPPAPSAPVEEPLPPLAWPVPQPPRPVEATPPTGSYVRDAAPATPAAPTTPAPAPAPAAEVAAPTPIVNDVAAVAAVPVEPEVPAAPAAVAPPAAKPAPRSPTHRRPWRPLVATAAVLVAVTGAVVGLRMTASRRAAPPAPAPVPTRPRPTAVPQPAVSQAALESLLAAEEAVAAGDLAAAQAALDAIGGADELTLGPAELGRLNAARSALGERRRATVLADLRQGLASGNLRVVRDTLRRLSRDDEAAVAGDPDAAQTLEEARRAVNLLTLATRAQGAGNNAQALEHASALVALAPRAAQAVEVREKAAAGLEQEAETLAGRGEFAEARGRLETVGRHWSARPGLAQRLERLRAAESNGARLAGVLAQAEQAAAERDPDRGLELLRSTSPPPYLEPRFRELRGRLEAVLREVDAEPPGLDLPATLKLEYNKNKPFVLVVRITDDHAVKEATLHLRVKDAGEFKALPLRRTQASEWSAEITTALHENKAVELYVVATDHSGHTGQLGSPQQPLVLKKKWGIFGR